MKKTCLNFFGETAEISLPSDLKTLRKNICDQFLFSPADAEELVISYIKGYTKVLIKTDADLKTLLQLKDVKELNLDVCENSKLYQEKKRSVEEEQQILFSALEMVKKEENDLINQNLQLIADSQSQQKNIRDQMRMLKDQLIKIHLDLKATTKENRMKIKEKRTTIKELEDKLNIPDDERWNPIEEAKKMFTHEKRRCCGMKREKRERKCCKARHMEIKEDNFLNKFEESLKNKVEIIKNTLLDRQKGITEKIKEVINTVSENPIENDQKVVMHYGVKCDGCGMKPIQGTRFKCAVCDDFDYCDACESSNANVHQHPFICIRNPKLSPTAIKCVIMDNMPEYKTNTNTNANA